MDKLETNKSLARLSKPLFLTINLRVSILGRLAFFSMFRKNVSVLTTAKVVQ